MPIRNHKPTPDRSRWVCGGFHPETKPHSGTPNFAFKKANLPIGKGWLLGLLRNDSLGPSTYDPARPAFAVEDWSIPEACE